MEVWDPGRSRLRSRYPDILCAGIATYREGDMSVDSVQIRADDALYQAKRAGRNHVIANG